MRRVARPRDPVTIFFELGVATGFLRSNPETPQGLARPPLTIE